MDKKRIGALMSLLGLSVALTACDVVAAQNIPSATSTAFNNGAGLGGFDPRIGMPGGDFGGGFGGNAGGMREAIDSDLIGRITAVNGDTMTLELMERGSTVAGDGARSPGGAADGQTEWIGTGKKQELELSAAVEISSGTVSRSGVRQGAAGSSREGAGAPDAATNGTSGDLPELKKGQIVMVWYAEGTQTAERIRILK